MPEDVTTTTGRAASPTAEYGPSYFSSDFGGAGPYERNEHWLRFFGEVAEGIVRDFHPTNALDAGCAMGFLVEQLRKRGVDASGIDISEYAISQVHDSVADHCRVASLTDPIPGRYDLVTCIEVLEHLPPSETDAALANLCAATDRLVFSSTPEDYGEPTHLNVLPPEAWTAKLAEHGFVRDLDRDLSYISPWAALYVRRDESRVEAVERYDRAWSRLRREVAEVRASLLRSQERIAELESGAGIESQPQLVEELRRRDDEILELRDQLIGKEAELGVAKGRLAQLDDQARRVDGARQRIEASIPLAGRLARAIKRLLRGRR